ncbi:TetR/AcrR family transcriptional regulator [Novosphingobium album (ex Hu et al. 2023)]|uniref:TetR/AcrR family transcriptional regulator n=1 Tax=Novosphingobium album (ex Hu et al. 2023) TaxID=2930093 RepID=A0ABT0B703_9SPHN|nr:TetR/AcrR family transcriptional regulator [Novosphingobium album (ex Hu et al. 2023)]MCJ2180845.1 TetR/AcrR family transcriptional regulator [Novosphingobium album (ex Hu et al. 2023)]
MAKTQQKSDRRMGPVGSENWHAMLDGAEVILREEGHAALTSRRVAEYIGVKQRLIYYYFRTMDELIVHTFHRLSERELARLTEAAKTEKPLRELWDVCIHTTDVRLISEFMALANRIEGLRQEVAYFIEESRAVQVRAIEGAVSRMAGKAPLPSSCLALIATSLALSLSREDQLGISAGHEEARDLIHQVFTLYEPDR